MPHIIRQWRIYHAALIGERLAPRHSPVSTSLNQEPVQTTYALYYTKQEKKRITPKLIWVYEDWATEVLELPEMETSSSSSLRPIGLETHILTVMRTDVVRYLQLIKLPLS
jgi:hypothetical protein